MGDPTMARERPRPSQSLDIMAITTRVEDTDIEDTTMERERPRPSQSLDIMVITTRVEDTDIEDPTMERERPRLSQSLDTMVITDTITKDMVTVMAMDIMDECFKFLECGVQ